MTQTSCLLFRMGQGSRHAERRPGRGLGGGGGHGVGPRRVEEGTWGLDNEGRLIPRHVFLGWNHGARRQVGTGDYETDGPVVPDIIGLTRSRLRNR